MDKKAIQAVRSFGAGGGVLGRIIDEFDWAGTSLGPIAGWPAVLCTTVELILRSPVPIVTLWGEDGVMLYNEAYSGFAGGRHPRLLGSRVREGWPEVADFNDKVMRVCLAGGTLSYRDHELVLRRSGKPEQVWMDLDYSPVVDAGGVVVGVIAIVVETTAKVRAERRLSGEHGRLQAMFEQAPGFMAQLGGSDHVFQSVNPAFRALAGGRALVGKPMHAALPETVPQGLVAMLDEVYLTGRACTAHARPVWLAQADGMRQLHYIDFVGQPLRREDGGVAGIFVQGSDVTGRVHAEAGLRESEAKFRTFAQAMPHQVWTATADGKFDWFNEHVYAYTGLDHVRLAGTAWTAAVHPDDLPGLTTRWAIAVASGATFDCEFRLRGADGCWRWHLARAIALRGDENEVVRWIGTNTDIEEQKTITRRLEHLNAGLEQQVAQRTAERDRMWRLSKDVMMVSNFEGSVEAVSPAFVALLGWSEHDVAGKGFLQLVHPDDRAATAAQMASLREGHYVYKFENRYRRKDGSWCNLSWSAAPDAAHIYAIGRDITADREQAEQIRRTELALQQSQKMETIGKLTGGVAHDFNNLLQIISGNLQLLEVNLSRAEEQRWIANARSAVEKGAKLASYLLAFGRRQPLEPKVVKLSRVISGMEDLLSRALGEEIAVELVISGGLWNTAVDLAQVENAVLNLAVNARDAMDGAGRLTIEANNAVLDDLYCRSHADVAPGQYVMLAVTDTGSGMPPEVLRQAFEPFFSTKDEGKGTGLGLSMVYGFARQSGGSVRIESSPGQGSEVRLLLPRHVQEVPLPEPGDAEVPLAPASHKGLVLVVDDEADIRTIMAEVLELQGYTVLQAGDAPQALRRLQDRRPDMLVTDIGLPNGMNGRQLADLVRAQWPQLPVLMVTGYAESTVMKNETLPAQMELLIKPFAMNALVGKVDAMLTQGALTDTDPADRLPA
ncbi:MAG TPA: PAS domain S-box protein [Telluria sp.]